MDQNTITNNTTIYTSTNNKKDIQKVANDFEELFMEQILKTSLKNTNIAGSSAGSKIIKDLYLEGMSKEISGSMGISQMLLKHLSKE
jgi:Rod binding domain-containing protein